MVTAFPSDNTLIRAAFNFFDISSKTLLMEYAPIVFLVRLMINKLCLKGKEHYGFLLRDTVFVFVGMMCFKKFMQAVLEIPNEAANAIDSFGGAESLIIDNKDQTLPGVFGSWFLDLGMGLSDFLKLIALSVYWIVYWLYFIFIFFMICLGSYVVFFAFMFNVTWVLSAFVIMIILSSLWPFLWYGADYVLIYAGQELQKNGSNLGIVVSSLIVNSFKIVLPLAGFLWGIKNPVGHVSGAYNSIKDTFSKATIPIDKTKQGLAKASQTISNNPMISQKIDNLQNARLQKAHNNYLNQGNLSELSGKNKIIGMNEFKQVKIGKGNFVKDGNRLVKDSEIKSKIITSNKSQNYSLNKHEFQQKMNKQIDHEIQTIKASGNSTGIGTNKIEQRHLVSIEKRALNKVVSNSLNSSTEIHAERLNYKQNSQFSKSSKANYSISKKANFKKIQKNQLLDVEDV